MSNAVKFIPFHLVVILLLGISPKETVADVDENFIV